MIALLKCRFTVEPSPKKEPKKKIIECVYTFVYKHLYNTSKDNLIARPPPLGGIYGHL